MPSPSFADIQTQFDQSLGYIRNDITAIRRGTETVNYTVALLVGCGCEMLAAGMGDRRHPEKVLAELLPPGDWRTLGRRLYTALRDGLAHSFDTKHLEVDGETVQIYISWSRKAVVSIVRVTGGLGLYVGIQPLAEALCARINEFEATLRRDEAARKIFKDAYESQRIVKLSHNEASAWRRLLGGHALG